MYPHIYGPVTLADPLELSCDEAGEQRPHSAAADKWLRHSSHPDVDVVGRTVVLQQPAGQVVVVQDPSKLCLVLGLRQAAEPAPGVVA